MEEIITAKPQGEKVISGIQNDYWSKSTKPLELKELDKNIDVDVVVVGGGIAGISAAYCALRSGNTVALVDDSFIGSGETGRTTAHLVTALDDRYYHLRKLYGEEKTKLIAESHRLAIDFIEIVVQNESIECDFERVPGYLFLHPSDNSNSLKKELIAAAEAGLEVEGLNDVPGMQNEKSSSIRFNNQAQFHPLKYVDGLSKAILIGGGLLFTETKVTEINEDGVVTKNGFRIKANHIVIATNSLLSNKFFLPLAQRAYRTYVIAARIKKGAVPKALWWDTGDHKVSYQFPPYHYVRLDSYNEDYDLLICGGEDHADAKDASKIPAEENWRYTSLEKWTREKFPIEDVVYQWSGQIMEPVDSLAFIGRNPLGKKNIYVITGDSGNGLTYATIAGMLIADLINGRKNKYEDLYKPSAVRLFKPEPTFIEQLISGLSSHIKKPWHDGERHIEHIPTGEGQVIEMDGKKYGAYHDVSDNIYIVNAECTHMKCTIQWNSEEKTWDCPCHGSRFTFKGKLIKGPANKDLDFHRVDISDFSKI